MVSTPKPAIFNFQETIALLDVGVVNFLFRNSAGDLLHVGYDQLIDRPVINQASLYEVEMETIPVNKLSS